MLTLHGSASIPWIDEGSKRGDAQLAFSDWEMLMAQREAAGNVLRFRAMTSFEYLALRGNGYPDLLEHGGSYLHAPIHDRQHPHDMLMELSAETAREIAGGLAASLYVAPVGEPALGPVAYGHRPSAWDDPMAPIGHHWEDASHQSFGVATLGLNAATLRVEASAFNAREADETHPVVDFRDARLDSYAGRISWAATPRVVGATWWGYLNADDRLDPTTRMHRLGASVITALRSPWGGAWSSTLMWGMNVHHHGAASHEVLHAAPGSSPHHASSALLAESSAEIGDGATIYGRAERAQISGEELGFQGGDLTTLYDVRSVVLGATRRVATTEFIALNLGVRSSVNFVPETLLATYGTRRPMGWAVYATVIPASRR
jgi:hypothetical protein